MRCVQALRWQGLIDLLRLYCQGCVVCCTARTRAGSSPILVCVLLAAHYTAWERHRGLLTLYELGGDAASSGRAGLGQVTARWTCRWQSLAGLD